MNITVTQTAPVRVEVGQPLQTVDVVSPIQEVTAVAKTVEIGLSGFYLERNINGDPEAYTIWFEDGT